MITTPEAVQAEIGYRMEQARDAALGARTGRPSLLRRLFTKAAARPAPSAVPRARPLSARI
jgi:hypothetical protein